MLTNETPEYVKHIMRPVVDTGVWCDADPGLEFVFTGLDHAMAEGLQEGRLLACPACVSAAQRALEEAMSTDEADETNRTWAIRVEMVEILEGEEGAAKSEHLTWMISAKSRDEAFDRAIAYFLEDAPKSVLNLERDN